MRRYALLVAFVGAFVFSKNVAATPFSFVLIDVPGATATIANDINNSGQIVGAYTRNGRDFGFLLRRGTYTTIDPPGSIYSRAEGINDRGDIVGWWNDAQGARHYFLYDGQSYTTFDSASPYTSDKLYDINNSRLIIGRQRTDDIVGFQPGCGCIIGFQLFGFFYDSGTFTPLNFPGAVETTPFRINNHGDVGGSYCCGNPSGTGFTYINGVYTSVSFPGADTMVSAIADNGRAVGFYINYSLDGVRHGFLLDNGVFTTINFPGTPDTQLLSINNRGMIVGFTETSPFVYHSYVGLPDGVTLASEPSTLILIVAGLAGLRLAQRCSSVRRESSTILSRSWSAGKPTKFLSTSSLA